MEETMQVGDDWCFRLPGLPYYKVPVGTVLRVIEDKGPCGEDRGFTAEVVSVPDPEPDPPVVLIQIPKGTHYRVEEV